MLLVNNLRDAAQHSAVSILMGWYMLLWGLMAVSPTDWQNWMLASLIPAVVVGGLVARRGALPLPTASYVMIGGFAHPRHLCVPDERPRFPALLPTGDDHRRPERLVGNPGVLGGSDRQP